MTNKQICASGMLTNIDAIPPAPATANIVTVGNDEIYDERINDNWMNQISVESKVAHDKSASNTTTIANVMYTHRTYIELEIFQLYL